MQIKHVGLPISSNKPQESQQPGTVASGAGQEGASGVGLQGPETLFISSMSNQRLDWLRLLLSNTDASLFKDMKEILGLLASIKAAASGKGLTGLLDSVENALLPLQEALAGKDFSGALVKSIIRLYTQAEDLKLNLLTLLVSLPKDEPQAAALKEKVGSFLNYLESVNFFNREGVNDTAAKTLFLYFPFAVASSQGKDKKLELVIYPEKDAKGRLRPDVYSFNITIDTESLGRVKVFMQVNKNRVSCNVGLDDPSAFTLFERSAPDLSIRLKKIRFILNSFDCCETRVEDYLPTLLPRLEVKA